MHRITVRIAALFSISVSIALNPPAKIPEGRNITPEVPAEALQIKRDVPPLDYSIVSLFAETRVRSILKPVVKQTVIPNLSYIGIVATAHKHIFSFKDSSTGKLILLEKGIETGGLTLVKDTETMCTLEIGGRLFKVGKK